MLRVTVREKLEELQAVGGLCIAAATRNLPLLAATSAPLLDLDGNREKLCLF